MAIGGVGEEDVGGERSILLTNAHTGPGKDTQVMQHWLVLAKHGGNRMTPPTRYIGAPAAARSETTSAPTSHTAAPRGTNLRQGVRAIAPAQSTSSNTIAGRSEKPCHLIGVVGETAKDSAAAAKLSCTYRSSYCRSAGGAGGWRRNRR